MAAARGQFVIVMDPDNTYPAEAIPRMIERGVHYDFVRYSHTSGRLNVPPINRIGNRRFDWMLKVVYGLEGADHLSGLYGLRREALQALCMTADRFDLQSDNDLMFAVLGSTVAFQLIVFGIAAALYGVEQGARPSRTRPLAA